MSQIVAFDVETPNRYNNRICSIGLTVINDGVITETLYYLINPEAEFDRTNIKIHGIKPNDVLDAPVFSDVWNDIREYFRSSLITAHNATFDLCVLRNTLQAYGISESKTNYVCTLQMAKNTIKDVENYRLPTLCKYAGIELKHHHALSDSYGCAELLRHFLNSGVTLDEYIKTFDFAVENKTNHSYRAKTLSNQNQSLKNLIDVLSAITCDGILVEEEIMFLQNWLDENRRLEGNYPYDKIFGTISNALAEVESI